MTSEQYVKQFFPDARAFPMIDNIRRQTSYVILKFSTSFEIFPNLGSRTPSNAWVNAKKHLIENNYKIGVCI
jgi:hypothetical protein